MKTRKNDPCNGLQARLDFETLLAEISAHFVNLPAKEIDAEIWDAHRRICEHLEVGLSALWQWSDDSQNVLTVTHLYGPPEAQALAAGIDAQKAFPWVLAKVLQGEVVVLPTIEMPPEAARDEESRRRFGAKSSLAIPLSVGGGPILGVLDFNIIAEERTWSDLMVTRLQLIAQLFANALVRKHSEEKLAALRRFEALITEIMATFINLPAEQLDAQIEDAQKRICDCLGVDLSALWQWSEKAPHYFTITHLHSPPDGPDHPVGIDAKEAFPWVFAKVLAGETLILDTSKMLPEARQDQESRRFLGVRSSVVIPLTAGGGELIGTLSFDDLKEEREWPRSIVQRLQLVAQIFANALARKRSDLQLRESQARLRMATESARIGLWIMEADSGHVWVTPRTRALFQFVEDEVLDYASFDQRIDPADRKRVKEAVQDAIHSGEPLDIEFRVVGLNKAVRWIRASGKRLSGPHGQGVRLMGASRDISHQKQAEKRLRKQLEEINHLKNQLEKENIYLREEIELKSVHEEIVGRSSVMRQLLSQVEQVAQTDSIVLIEGETGTGKELLARAVHRLSARKQRPLVTVNCASLPPTLVESELFGREKGAYTGALTQMKGRFEAADGATLFLDEIGELTLEVQAKLLRVLEQGCFERLGSTQSIRVDVRIIAATNKDLAKQVAAGRFRKDLYYRLNVFPIHLPPLRERPEDIPALVWHFVRNFEPKMGKRIDHIPRRCMGDLQHCGWPGNVRELRNVIERALIVNEGRNLDIRPPSGQADGTPATMGLEEIERQHIKAVLLQTSGRVSGKGGAAEILGLKRTTLQSKMKKLGIQRPT